MMRRRLHSAVRNDSGAILVVAMLVLLVVALLSTTMLTQTSASVANTANVALHDDRLAAAQSGIENGMQQLRADDTICSDVAASPTKIAAASGGLTPALSINGYSVEVTCQTTSGSSSGVGGYAVIALSTAADALVTGGGNDKSITGGVYVAGGLQIGNSAPLTVRNGNFRDLTPCTQANWPTVTPSFYTAGCTQTAVTLPALTLETVPGTPGTPLVNPVTSGGTTCKVFYPGTYTSPPALDTTGTMFNYFASGPYLFDFGGGYNTATWTLKQTVVIGGVPVDQGSGGLVESPEQFAFPACATAAEAARSGTYAGSKGVTFQFKGKSHLDFDTGGHMELYTREPTSGDFRPSILTTYATAPYQTSPTTNASTLTDTEDLIVPKTGNTPDINIHGEYFAPNAKLSLVATNDVHTQFEAGVVTAKISLSDSSSGLPDKLKVANERTAGNRVIKLVSTSSGRGRTVTSTAYITIRNDDPNRAVGVRSWRSD